MTIVFVLPNENLEKQAKINQKKLTLYFGEKYQNIVSESIKGFTDEQR